MSTPIPIDGLPRKPDGSINKSAVVRAAYETLVHAGVIDPDAPLSTRVHAVRRHLHTQGLAAALEHGTKHYYMLYSQALKQLPWVRARPMLPTAAELAAESERPELPPSRVLPAEPARDEPPPSCVLPRAVTLALLSALDKERDVECARGALATLVAQGWTRPALVELVEEALKPRADGPAGALPDTPSRS